MGWLGNWKYQYKLTIDKDDVTAALSNFPILVYLSASSGITSENISFIFSELGANRKKFAITLADGVTQCYVEIEKWDNGNNKAWLWVKVSGVDSISPSVDTDLYFYFDNTKDDNNTYVGDTNSVVAESVWDTNFKFVSHMLDNPDTSNIRDSTSYDNDGAKKGPGEPAVTALGEISDAQHFDGNDDYINISGIMNDLSRTLGTIELWINADTLLSGDLYFFCSPHYNDNNRIYIYHTTTTLKIGIGNKGAETVKTISTGTWYHVALVWDNGTYIAYLNSVNEASDTFTGLGVLGATAFLGSWAGTAQFLDGIDDEVRVSDVARSASWIKASYESGRDDFITFGTLQSFGSKALSCNVEIKNAASKTRSCNFVVNQSNASLAKSCNVEIKNASTNNLSCNLEVKNAGTADRSMNAYIMYAASDVRSCNLEVKNASTIDFSANVEIKNADTADRSCNVEIKNAGTIDFSCNVEIKNIGAVERSCNVEIKNTDTSNLSCNVVIKNVGTINRSCNAYIYFVGSDEYSVNVEIKNVDTIDFSCNAEIKNIDTIDRSCNLEVKNTDVANLSCNAEIKNADVINLSCNVEIKNADTIALSCNLEVKNASTDDFSCNVEIKNASSADYSCNVKIKNTFTIDVSCNAEIKNASSANYSCNVEIKNADEINVSMNMYIYFVDTIAMPFNVEIKNADTINLSANTVIRNADVVDLSCNVVILNASTINRSSNVEIKNAGTINRSLNAVIRNANEENYTCNVVIRNAGSIDLSCNAYIMWAASVVRSCNVIVQQTPWFNLPQLSCNFLIQNVETINRSCSFGIGPIHINMSCNVNISCRASINLSMSFAVQHNSHWLLRDQDFTTYFRVIEAEGSGSIGMPVLTNVNTPKQQGANALRVVVENDGYEKIRIIHYSVAP